MRALLSFRSAIFLVSGLVAIDYFSKQLIRQQGGFFVCNQGISFGLRVHSVLFWLLCGLFLVFWLSLMHFTKSKLAPNKARLVSLLVIFAGAVANLLDRFLYGCVTDFIAFFGPFFPFFNLADLYLSFGAAFFIYLNFKTVNNLGKTAP